MYIGIQCHVSVTWLHVFVTPISKHLASQYRWQEILIDVLKLVKKKKRLWPVLYLSVPDIKTNGRLAFLIICKELDFLKLQRCNRVVSLIRGLTKTTTARATGTSKQAIGLISKITTPHVHYFLQISLPFLHNYDVK